MPYIKKDTREYLQAMQFWNVKANTPGELNFCFTFLLDRYLGRNGTNYQSINDCLGALEGAKLEFYRRVAVPYEEIKIKANGDVY